MFVEPTPNSELVNLLRKTESKHRVDDETRVKFVEKSGIKTIDLLKVQDPFRKNCSENDCLACSNSDGKYTNCRKNNITYRLSCNLCAKRGLERSYEGESCRNLYLRGREHRNNFLKKVKNNH